MYNMYLGKSDSSDPGHQVLFIVDTEVNDFLLVLGEGTSWLQEERERE